MELLTFHSSINAKFKTWFSQKENLKKYTSFEEQKGVQVIFLETFILTLSSLAIFLLQNRVSDFFFCCLGDKRRLSDFLRKWSWFYGHDVRLPKSIDSKLEFKKTETRFCRWASNDHNDISIFLSLENLCSFMLDLKSHF